MAISTAISIIKENNAGAIDKMEQTYTLTLTENCNLSCIYCYEHNRNGRSMSFATAKRILDKAFSSMGNGDLLTIDFFGGEPFLEYRLIKEIVDYTNRAATTGHLRSNYRFFATTNGTLIHGEMQDWLRKNKNFYLGLSLDGNKYIHDMNRSHSFDRIDLDFFLTMYPEQLIKMTISDITLPYLAEGIIFCHTKGFQVACNLAYGVDWTKENLQGKLEEQLDKLISFYITHPNIHPCTLLDRNVKAATNTDRTKTTARKWGGAGTAMHTYDCDGTNYPCQYFMPISCGKEKSEQAKYLQFYDEIPSLSLDEKCRSCIVKEVCPTCYGSNYLQTGNIYHKNDEQCVLEKIIFYANACFVLKRWDAGQLENKSENDLIATLLGAKQIIEQFAR